MDYLSFPNKKYNIIYADPPWSYKDKAVSGKRGVCFKYKTQNIEWIKNLPVKSITDKNCILFLWVTLPKLNECFDVIKAWGFEYKTCAFVWIKKNKKKDSNFWGMGNYTRSNAELCLLSTKGKIKRVSSCVHSVVESKIQKHSKKPHEVRRRIIQLVGDLPRIELFAREKIDKWDVWGDEI